MTNNEQKYVLVTGANGGMGKSVCNLLARSGYTVFALDLSKQEHNCDNIIPILADITDINSLNSAKVEILMHTNQLYALINLAGYFAMDSIVNGEQNKLEKCFEVNFWGVYRTNKVFFDLLDSNSRIVVMSSEVARYSLHPFDGFYALPKVAVDNYCDVLRRECRFLGIKVVKIQAGSFNTGMTKKAQAEFDTLKQTATQFNDVLQVFDKFVGKELAKGKDTDIIAKLIQKIVNLKTPKGCYRVKNSLKLMLINALPEKTQDGLYPFAVKLLGNKSTKKQTTDKHNKQA